MPGKDLVALVPADRAELSSRLERLVSEAEAFDLARDRSENDDGTFDAVRHGARVDAWMEDEPLATFLGDLLVTHGRALRGRASGSPVRSDPRLFVRLLDALARAPSPTAAAALERCVDQLVEERAFLLLATLRDAPREEVRARVARCFEAFRDAPGMRWADALGLGLPVDRSWKVAIRVVNVSRSDPRAKHKRASTAELRCAVHHPPLHLDHAVQPLDLAWSIDLSGAEPWSGSWIDTEPDRPLVDATRPLRPVRHPLQVSPMGLPALAETLGERMGTRFFLEEATVSVDLDDRSSASVIEERVRRWLASPAPR